MRRKGRSLGNSNDQGLPRRNRQGGSSSAGRSNVRSESSRNPGHSRSGGCRRSGSVSLLPKCRMASLRGLSTEWRRRVLKVAPAAIRRAVVLAGSPAVTAPNLAAVVILPELDTLVDQRMKSMGNKSGTAT